MVWDSASLHTRHRKSAGFVLQQAHRPVLQDSWRVRPNLTLNYGVRYDLEFPPSWQRPLDWLWPDTTSWSAKRDSDDKKNIQPRIGVAFDPKGDGKTVIRASFGMFFDHPLLGLYFLGDASDGFKSGQLLFFGTSPCGTSASGISPLNISATNLFQGILATPDCLPPGLAERSDTRPLRRSRRLATARRTSSASIRVFRILRSSTRAICRLPLDFR